MITPRLRKEWRRDWANQTQYTTLSNHTLTLMLDLMDRFEHALCRMDCPECANPATTGNECGTCALARRELGYSVV